MDSREGLKSDGTSGPSGTPSPESSGGRVRELKRAKRREIVERDLRQDRDAVVSRWLDTVVFTDEERGSDATFVRELILMTFCLIKYADFEVSSTGNDKEICEFTKPSPELCVADYLSHASRIILDPRNLDPKYARALRAIYGRRDDGYYEGLDSRASTHALVTDVNGQLVEIKSREHGAWEAAKNVVKAVGSLGNIAEYAKQFGVQGPDTTDYGIDVLMGGKGRPNLSGGYSELGKDGHFLIHHSEGILVGLEQSRPAGTYSDLQGKVSAFAEGTVGVLRSAFSFASLDSAETTSSSDTTESSPSSHRSRQTPSPDPDDDPTHGLSGAHSMTGAADEYTAAGSLYFSNLLYKLKLLEETGELAPKKYNGMRIVLSKRAFIQAYKTFDELRGLESGQLEERLRLLLTSTPNNAYDREDAPNSRDENYLRLFDGESRGSIKAFIKQVKSVGSGTNLDSFTNGLGDLLERMKPWIAYFLHGGELPEFEPSTVTMLYNCSSRQLNVEQLRHALNQTTLVIRKRAIDEIKCLMRDTSSIEKADWLYHQYCSLGDELDKSGEVFQHLKAVLAERKRLISDIEAYLRPLEPRQIHAPAMGFFEQEAARGLEQVSCPLPHLVALHRIEAELKALTSTNEARIVLRLMPAPSSQAERREDTPPREYHFGA